MSTAAQSIDKELAFKIRQQQLLVEKNKTFQEIKHNYEDGVSEEREASEQLLKLADSVAKEEAALRKSFHLENKPSFVSTQFENLKNKLKTLLAPVLAQPVKNDEHARRQLGNDEAMVYIYMFNVQGQSLRTWRTLLSPAVFKDLAVHHPVYSEVAQAVSLIHSKRDKSQHGYVAVKVKKADILGEAGVDDLGQPRIRLKYGALAPENIIGFTNMEREYRLGKEGDLTPV